MSNYQRIVVIGSPGAGKSTFSKQLSKIIDIPLYHLDRVYWLPNFTDPNPDDWEKKHNEIIKKDKWIIDGNYYSTMKQRLERATIVYFLDYSRYLCVKSALRRMKEYENGKRDDITTGCVETYDREFLQWIWDFPVKYRPEIIKELAEHPNIEIISFKTRDEANRYLEKLKKEFNQ